MEKAGFRLESALMGWAAKLESMRALISRFKPKDEEAGAPQNPRGNSFASLQLDTSLQCAPWHGSVTFCGHTNFPKLACSFTHAIPCGKTITNTFARFCAKHEGNYLRSIPWLPPSSQATWAKKTHAVTCPLWHQPSEQCVKWPHIFWTKDMRRLGFPTRLTNFLFFVLLKQVPMTTLARCRHQSDLAHDMDGRCTKNVSTSWHMVKNELLSLCSDIVLKAFSFAVLARLSYRALGHWPMEWTVHSQDL